MLTDEEKVIQQAGLADPFFFVHDILGYRETVERIHGDILDFILERIKRESLLLIPRKHFKTSVVTVGYTIWRLVNDPNLRVLIVSKTLESSKAMMSEIKGHFEKNHLLRKLYGDLVGDVWTDTKIVLSTRAAIKKEPSILCASTDKELASGHFDLIINDDLVGLEDQLSEAARNHTSMFYRLMRYLTDKDTQIIDIGTRWHLDDLYKEIMDTRVPEEDRYIRAAIINGAVYFHERFSQAELDADNRADPITFSAQMMNNPLPFGTSIYKLEELTRIPFSQFPKFEDMGIYFYCDLAYKQTAKNAKSAIVTIGQMKDKLYILDVFNERVPADVVENELMARFRRYTKNLIAFGGEDNGGQSIFYDRLKKRVEKEIPELNREVFRIKTETQDKTLKLNLAKPRIIREAVFRDDWTAIYPELITQIIHFGSVTLKDAFDALVGAMSLTERDAAKLKEWSDVTGPTEKKRLINKYSGRST